MVRNEAGWDRMARVLVGMVILSTVFLGPRTWWGLLGLIPLLTGLAGYCPLYQLLGFSSCPVETTRRTPPK